MTADTQEKTIVFIEDDETLGKVLTEELTDAGFRVVRAKDGEAGLALVRSARPNLVLLDVLMPKKQGFEVLQELKGASDTRYYPVFILTALGDEENLRRGLALGADGYSVKSAQSLETIVAGIKAFFEKQASARGASAEAP
jgi:two-component system phosphate regulon response regulator PhoB